MADSGCGVVSMAGRQSLKMGRTSAFAVLLALPSALAHSTFMKHIPNGNNVHDQFGKAWVAVGHTAASPDDVPNFASDGFERNPFGWAFAKAGQLDAAVEPSLQKTPGLASVVVPAPSGAFAAGVDPSQPRWHLRQLVSLRL